MRRYLLVLTALALFAAVPTVASAQIEEEAARQIALAREDLAAGNYERAVNAASSALRLNPLLYEGLIIKGLAYEQLHETMLAYSLLITYQDLSRGMVENPLVEPALDRLRGLIGGGVAAVSAPGAPVAPAPASSGQSASEAGPAAQFEILSRRNQEDLFEQLNEALPAGPAYARFRSQSRNKGDDFYFGLADVRWDDGEADFDDAVFTLILDSDKLVTKGREGAKLPFADRNAEHDVQVWFDGTSMAVRVDGQALGPFETRSSSGNSKWFLSLNDEARAWNLEVWPWEGSLGDGFIPSGFGVSSYEEVTLSFNEVKVPDILNEDDEIRDLPDTTGAPHVRVSMSVTCKSKSSVIVGIDDGREVTVGRDIRVRGAAKMPKISGGLECSGRPEAVVLEFAGDGAVWGSVGGQSFPRSYPGRRPDGRAEIRAKGKTAVGSDLIIEVAKRPTGRRVFRAVRTE